MQHEQPRADWRAVSDLIDRVLAHRWLGLPFFLAAMYATFWIAFSLGEVPMGWIEAGVEHLGSAVAGLWPEGSDSLLRSLLVDGVIGGVGGVIVFVPNIALLFLCLSLLEDTGYLARAAFLVDRLMHRFGLHGKSFLPMITGFGCSIPGIMATRTLENERDRLSTMMVLPLMSCGARLPIWMVLIPAFVAAKWRALALWGVYAAGIVVALGLVFLLRRTLLRGEEAPFVMELPPYRLPTLRAAASRTLERSWLYLRKAGTIILAISLLMWLASTFPQKPTFEVDSAIASGQLELSTVAAAGSALAASAGAIDAAELEQRRAAEALSYSLAGRLGHAMQPLLSPLGFDWRLNTALVGAFAAKEVFVSQMGIIYSLGDVGGTVGKLSQALQRDYSPLVGLSLMLFLLIASPCMATMAATRRESGSWWWALLQFGGLTVVAYLVSLLVYQGGMLVSGGQVDLDAVAVVLVFCAACWMLARKLVPHLPFSANAPRYTGVCGTCASCPSSAACAEQGSSAEKAPSTSA